MKIPVLLVFVSLFSALSSLAATLPATVIMRAAGPADDPGRYKSGLISVGKAMAGQKGDLNWKAFVVFDVVSEVEDLAQNPEATLRLAFDWVKSSDDVRDIKIHYIGCMPKANFVDKDMWPIFGDQHGTEIGQLEAHQLASLKQRSWIEIDLKGQIPSGEVTPVNRYMVFRVQSEQLLNPEGNGLVGLAPDVTAHTLTVGDEAAKDSSSTGGY